MIKICLLMTNSTVTTLSTSTIGLSRSLFSFKWASLPNVLLHSHTEAPILHTARATFF